MEILAHPNYLPYLEYALEPHPRPVRPSKEIRRAMLNSKEEKAQRDCNNG